MQMSHNFTFTLQCCLPHLNQLCISPIHTHSDNVLKYSNIQTSERIT